MRDNLYVEVVFGVSDARYNGRNDHENEQDSRDRRIFEARRKHLELFDMFGMCNVCSRGFYILMPLAASAQTSLLTSSPLSELLPFHLQ